MIMESFTPSESKTQQTLHDADAYVRENPVPALLCAVGVGFALGLLVRALDRPKPADVFHSKLSDAGGYLGSLIAPVAYQSKRAYHKSADAVRDAVESAKDIDVDDYTDPVVSWVSRIWKKCCS
ncbi:MAG: hypothetical protein EOP84_07395 [Verrucomicrobiaceae bacterium]|nr:MAG: hypothetical protein EOP84_07395 [Verrucomicrobiaceae bacterium]